MDVADLSAALGLIRTDSAKLLGDMLQGISMWGVTSLMAFLVSAICLALGETILTYAHPYGTLPQVLEALYASYALAGVSAVMGVVLLARYYTLKRRYTSLYRAARNLR